jgi:hypothetical protein
MNSRILMTIVATALISIPMAALADSPASLEQLVVEMADSPAEHAAVANHFRAKAAEARGQASKHESMSRAYSGGKLNTRIQMRGHCDKLAEQYGAMAAEYEELAKLHDAAAGAARE